MRKPVCLKPTLIIIVVTLLFFNSVRSQTNTVPDSLITKAVPVVLASDTLFNIYSGIGTFNASERSTHRTGQTR